MEKTYKVTLDTDVIGATEVEKLADDLESVAINAERAQYGLDDFENTTSDAVETNEEFSSSAADTSKGIAVLTKNATLAGAAIMGFQTRSAMTGANMIRMGSQLWGAGLMAFSGALTVVIGALATYSYMLKSSEFYVQSNHEAMKEFQATLSSDEAWKIFNENMDLYLGEKSWNILKRFRSFWNKFYEAVLYQFGGEGGKIAVQQGKKITEMMIDLNDQQLIMSRTMPVLNASMTEQQDIFNDSTKTLDERLLAVDRYLMTLERQHELELEELEIQYEIVQTRIAAGNATEENIKEEARLGSAIYKLNFEHKRLLKQMELRRVEIKDDEYKQWLDKLQKERDLLSDINSITSRQYMTMQRMLDLMKQSQGTQNLLGEDKDPELKSYGITLEEDKNEQAALHDNRVRFYEDIEMLQTMHLDNMAGSMLSFVHMMKDLYNLDLKWATMTTDQKIKVAAAGAQAVLGVASALVGALAEVASDDFETQKKYRIALAVVDTLQGAIAAFMGGVSAAPGPWGIALGAILAAATLAMGYANIKKIQKTTPESVGIGSSGFGGNTNTPTGSPSFSLVQPLSSGYVADATNEIPNGDIEPQKAYVVSDDVTSGQEMDRQLEANATV